MSIEKLDFGKLDFEVYYILYSNSIQTFEYKQKGYNPLYFSEFESSRNEKYDEPPWYATLYEFSLKLEDLL